MDEKIISVNLKSNISYREIWFFLFKYNMPVIFSKRIIYESCNLDNRKTYIDYLIIINMFRGIFELFIYYCVFYVIS